MIEWPPNVIIKQHPRARHVKLKASIKHGLELVVPRRFNHKEIPFILEQNRTWIEKQLLKIQSLSKTQDVLPNEISFSAISQFWKIEYIPIDKKLHLMTRPQQFELVLIGKVDNKELCKKLLISWIKDQARDHLLNNLHEISRQTNLPYQTLTIRSQNTRWGSCSADKSINLNYKLLFLPFELMRHIMVHELCHTIHLNHSDKFWNLVEKFDPEWKKNRSALRKTDNFIPQWLCK